MFLTVRFPLVALCLALGLHAGAAMAQQGANPVTVAAQTPELSTFHRLIQQAGLESTLSSGAFTVFAPTDDAFKAVPAATLDKLAKEPELLRAVLTYHVLPGKTSASAIGGAMSPATVNGAKLNVSKSGDFVTVDDSLVIKADLAAGDSVIHEVDRVLMPPKK